MKASTKAWEVFLLKKQFGDIFGSLLFNYCLSINLAGKLHGLLNVSLLVQVTEE